MNLKTTRSISSVEMMLIGGGVVDAPFTGIAPGRCILRPPQTPTKPQFPSDSTND